MATTHRNRYKTAGMDSSEMRRRREEEGVQLRKQKREQQLTKRRNVLVIPSHTYLNNGIMQVKTNTKTPSINCIQFNCR